MRIRINVCLIVLCCCLLGQAAQNKKQDPIEKLLGIKLPSVYHDDGAGDGTLTQYSITEIQQIISLGSKAIPLLIQHLDDCRPTTVKFSNHFDKTKLANVPLGYVCLDILSNIVDDKSVIFVTDCVDDGLGACIKDGYYFRPDDYLSTGNLYNERPIVRIVKKNWLRAFQQGKLKFKYKKG